MNENMIREDIVGSRNSSSLPDGLWRLTLSNEDIYQSWTKGKDRFNRHFTIFLHFIKVSSLYTLTLYKIVSKFLIKIISNETFHFDDYTISYFRSSFHEIQIGRAHV